MKERHKRSALAWASVGWFCLLVGCSPATIDESAGNAQPVDTSSTAFAPSAEEAEAQPTDIIDRIFSPLDNAVTDINRDLNKGGADTPPESNE